MVYSTAFEPIFVRNASFFISDSTSFTKRSKLPDSLQIVAYDHLIRVDIETHRGRSRLP